MSDHIVATLTDLSHRPADRGKGTNRVVLLLTGGLTVSGHLVDIVSEGDHAVVTDGARDTLVNLSAVLAVQYVPA
jgi:hypothetical protein